MTPEPTIALTLTIACYLNRHGTWKREDKEDWTYGDDCWGRGKFWDYESHKWSFVDCPCACHLSEATDINMTNASNAHAYSVARATNA